ncbi:MAG: ShlB/FhaC/HecB family hemolysin secretion/activation protein [Candidatus Omnitrophica bacterium]|nr:ShlB/FhaC/HecB family hemolysin secretion/activation protein [Candidatus Omnitrophota bacterium]
MKYCRLTLVLLATFSLILFYYYPAIAQSSPGQDIGAQSERLRKDLEEKEKSLQKKVQPQTIEIKKEKEETAPAPAVYFVLKEIRITGVSLFKPEELEPIYKPYIGKEVILEDLEEITEKIKAKYTQEGYPTAVVYIPEQEIKKGVVEIAVAEGKMGELIIENNKYFSGSFLSRQMHLKKNSCLDISQMERDLLRLNKNPDIQAKAVISAGKEAQASDVTLKIKDTYPWHLGFSVDNQGSRLTGKIRNIYSLRSSNFLGNGDYFFLNAVTTSESWGQMSGYVLPLGTQGRKIGLDATYYKMRLGKEFKDFKIRGRSQIYNVYFSDELYLSRNLEASLDLGMEIKCIDKTINGVQASDDQLRIPYFGFNLSKTDSFGWSSFSPRFNFSCEDFLGAASKDHPSASRAGTGGFFFQYEQTLNRLQRMPWGSYLSLRSQFQVASNSLPSCEQFQLGGFNSVRGYPEGDYLADIGTSLNCEWVFPTYLIPVSWKLAKQELPLQKQIETVLFADFGWGRLKKNLTGRGKRQDSDWSWWRIKNALF